MHALRANEHGPHASDQEVVVALHHDVVVAYAKEQDERGLAFDAPRCALDLVGRRRPYRFEVLLRRARSAVEHILSVEVIGPSGVRAYKTWPIKLMRHPIEFDRSFRWLGLQGDGRNTPWRRLLAPAEPLPSSWGSAMDAVRESTARIRDLQQGLLAFEQCRRDAIEAAADLVAARPERADYVNCLPGDIHDAVMEAMDADPTGRIEQMARLRPWRMCSLAIALGDAPSRWLPDGRLAAPLQLVVDGARDRDVLAAAVELRLGSVPTSAHVRLLGTLGERILSESRTWLVVSDWAYLAGALHSPCEPSWLALPDGGVSDWARAQCWAQSREFPPLARRYVARYGGPLNRELARGVRMTPVGDAVADTVRDDAAALLRQAIPPRALVRRILLGRLPSPSSLAERVVHGDIVVQRLGTGAEVQQWGRRLRCCVRDLENLDDYLLPCHEGCGVFLGIAHSSGVALAFAVPYEGEWRLEEFLADPGQSDDPDLRHLLWCALRAVGLAHDGAGLSEPPERRREEERSTAPDEAR